jgi:hypothetical protein
MSKFLSVFPSPADQVRRFLPRCDALGNLTVLTLSSGSAYDLQGAEVLLAQIAADTLIAEPLMYMSESLTGSTETAKAL